MKYSYRNDPHAMIRSQSPSRRNYRTPGEALWVIFVRAMQKPVEMKNEANVHSSGPVHTHPVLIHVILPGGWNSSCF